MKDPEYDRLHARAMQQQYIAQGLPQQYMFSTGLSALGGISSLATFDNTLTTGTSLTNTGTIHLHLDHVEPKPLIFAAEDTLPIKTDSEKNIKLVEDKPLEI